MTIAHTGGAVAVLAVRGEIDTLTAPQLESALADLLDAGTVPVVDLREVTFLASSGLAVLIHAANRVGERQGRMTLVAASRAVRRPLEITGSDRLFDLRSDLHGAGGSAD